MSDLQARAEALLALVEKMTPGPYYVDPDDGCAYRDIADDPVYGSIPYWAAGIDNTDQNPYKPYAMSFDTFAGIVALRNDAPGIIRDLLAEVDEASRLHAEEQEKYLALLLEVMPTWIMAENFKPDMAIQEATRLRTENAALKARIAKLRGHL